MLWPAAMALSPLAPRQSRAAGSPQFSARSVGPGRWYLILPEREPRCRQRNRHPQTNSENRVHHYFSRPWGA